MFIVLSLLMMGVSLSMDTFSVFLSLGTFNISKNKILFFCIFIGILHFLMPIFGNFLGYKMINYLNIKADILLGLVLILIGIEMIIELNSNEEKHFSLNIINMIIISISVSLDSFTTGFGLSAITNNYILSGLIFSICASLFTFLGYLIGKYSNDKLGIYANILGIIILLTLGIYHIFV